MAKNGFFKDFGFHVSIELIIHGLLVNIASLNFQWFDVLKLYFICSNILLKTILLGFRLLEKIGILVLMGGMSKYNYFI